MAQELSVSIREKFVDSSVKKDVGNTPDEYKISEILLCRHSDYNLMLGISSSSISGCTSPYKKKKKRELTDWRK